MQSFGYAIQGIMIAWREEFNFRFHCVVAACTVILAWFLHLSPLEWAIMFLLIGFVLAAEAINTALEELCDKFQPTHDPHIAKIKDLGAAAVLIASIAAIIVGCFIFIPHILRLT